MRFPFLIAIPLVALPVPAWAVDVVFTGALINSCVLNISTPGVLATSTDGSSLSSENVGGVGAVLAVVAVGSAPTLNFTAPSLQSPAGFSGTPTTSIRYQALSGASRAYTSSASSITVGNLIDTVTVHSRVQNSSGFVSGTYTVRSTVTCQQ